MDVAQLRSARMSAHGLDRETRLALMRWGISGTPAGCQSLDASEKGYFWELREYAQVVDHLCSVWAMRSYPLKRKAAEQLDLGHDNVQLLENAYYYPGEAVIIVRNGAVSG